MDGLCGGARHGAACHRGGRGGARRPAERRAYRCACGAAVSFAVERSMPVRTLSKLGRGQDTGRRTLYLI